MAMAKRRQRRTRCLRILFLKASFTKFCVAIVKLPFRFVLPSSFSFICDTEKDAAGSLVSVVVVSEM